MSRSTPLRKLKVILLLLAVGTAMPVAAQSSFSAGMGVNFFRYDTPYLTAMNATYLYELSAGMELNLGAEFGIHADNKNEDGDTVPSILIPVNVGLNFTFPQERTTFVFGTGITPVFNLNPETDKEFQFFMGPYVKAAVRVRVHPIMSWFVEAQQDLLIGGEDWINTGTRLATGINFSFSPFDGQ